MILRRWDLQGILVISDGCKPVESFLNLYNDKVTLKIKKVK